ncbi:MAG: N-6 DNA methylase [Deltaproteobacteria bacterium]|nr:N-6 DNA methylase [Deltaproteobacteria bacterium]
MMNLSDLLANLRYDKSSYYRDDESLFEPETAHLFRAARKAGVDGIYVFQASSHIGSDKVILPFRPAVYVAQANTEDEARKIHRSLWNLRYAPFLIILLPNQIRIYTGFDYSESDNRKGVLDEIGLECSQIRDLLEDLSADAVDTGQIWQSKYIDKFDPKQRVDTRLLANLSELSKALDKALGQTIKDSHQRLEVAHALIGKYIYIRYLQDRNILSEEWLTQNRINLGRVLGRDATVAELQKLVETLEDRFNGYIFPLGIDAEKVLTNEQVQLVASIFKGDEVKPTGSGIRQQLHLDFKAYDFQYIPVETLSAIYEQFLRAEEEVKQTGAIYTPENLADYLLSEVNWAKPLKEGMKILDPACGSGIFLVLAYRRLIELERAARPDKKLLPKELKKILLDSLYGVERKRSACHVTEFSLILTLLHYIDPPELHKNTNFKFPNLHNERIFEGDFFDDNSEFWQLEVKFDWIVGNPPWIKLKPQTKGEELARKWITENQTERPVAGNRVADAFSWRVVDLLQTDGVVGLILPATSLFNLKSKTYRQHFFQRHKVARITNFANLRDVLFDKRATLPATTIIYRQTVEEYKKSYIIHYGPFSINQTSRLKNKPWAITINENEIQTVSSYEAETGETSVWKFALWGTHFDKRAIERIRSLFPDTLKKACIKRGWPFHRDIELRNGEKTSNDKLEHVPELRGKKWFHPDSMRQSLHRFSIPQYVLEDIPDKMCYIRKRGGKSGLKVIHAPHIILSPIWNSYIIYSDEDFVLPLKHIGIAASEKDIDDLRALSVYLSSSLVAYYLFFHTHEWGIFRQARWVSITEVGTIPTPNFTLKQTTALARLQKELVETEQREISYPVLAKDLHTRLQARLDEKVFSILDIPKDIATLAREFVNLRLQLDRGRQAIQQVTRLPHKQELLAYAQELRDELDDFVMGTVHHRVVVTRSKELIECVVEITQKDIPIPVNEDSIRDGDQTTSKLLAEIRDSIGQQFSQWVYVQRGLRLFDGPRIFIYKPARLIDWTRTQALNDANDIIGQVHSMSISNDEESRT